VTRFSDGVHRYQAARWSHGGKLLTYVSNARNGRDFDLYVADPATAGSERRVAELEGQWYPSDWSADDTRLLVLNYISANLSHLWAFDVASGERTRVSPDPGEEMVAWGGGRWSPDGTSVYTTTDHDGEFQRLVRLDLGSGAATTLTGDIDWDVESFALSDDGALIAMVINEDGFSKIRLLDTASGAIRPGPELPPGVAGDVAFRPGSHEVAFVLSWARSPRDVWSFDAGDGRGEAGKAAPWTASEAGGLPVERFSVPELVRYPTFDETAPGQPRTIPAMITRPDAGRFPPPWPVYIDIPGGPEGQERPGFLGSLTYLVEQLGVALVQPNVRGSSGYGKSYLLLDNAAKREDSVRDIGALIDWVGRQQDLDGSRVMVGGGSYGGFMSLASLTHYADRLRCGFDYVGISNFVTFLENTQDYRRDLRRAEYGDERDPEMRALLEEISPANQVDRLTVPLLVAQGANDPRVPLSESDQVVEAVAKRGTPVWYLVAEDEGHGFAKKSNADYLRVALIEFIDRCLLGDGIAAAGGDHTSELSEPSP
jgi:dipeptidyl aminopeptidase/acylaminoacyl peptidase